MEQNSGNAPEQTASGGSRGGEVARQAKEQGRYVTQQAREWTGELANRGGEQVKSQLANQKHEAAQRLMPVQTALRETAQQLRKQDQRSMGQYADKAADGVDRVSNYLRDTDVDEMTEEVRYFARRSPAVFLSGAAALGFLATRFLKSSSQGRTGSGGAASYRDGAPTTPAHTDAERDVAVGRTATMERTPLAGQSPDEGGRSGVPGNL